MDELFSQVKHLRPPDASELKGTLIFILIISLILIISSMSQLMLQVKMRIYKMLALFFMRIQLMIMYIFLLFFHRI